MTKLRVVPCTAALLTLALTSAGLLACKSEEKPAEEKKADDKKPEPLPEPDPEPAVPEIDLSGPLPPETSAVFFSVDGALLPLACFDKDKKELRGGKGCRSLVAEGSEIYMASSFGKKTLEKTGAGTKQSICGDEDALPTPQLDAGGAFDWASYPKSLARNVVQIDPKTWSDYGAMLSEEETAAVQAVIQAARKVEGNFVSKQKATADIDGDGKDELFISAVIANAKEDGNLYSGLFMAPGGDLSKLVLLEKPKKDNDVIRLRGVVDLDGDGKRELWTSITFDGGNGDHVVRLVDDKAEPLAGWTCGA